MARLLNEEWLHHAKSLPVGQQKRVRHGHEPTDAMTVGNREDRLWAYCQRCKTGAVETKSHVLLGSTLPQDSAVLSIPVDGMPIHDLLRHEREQLARFLSTKNMDMIYLNMTRVTWSPSRKRLLLHTPSGLMGRDTTGSSAQKWLTYDRQHWITDIYDATCDHVVLVEDCFSWAKVKYALGLHNVNASVFCTLGTAIHDSLFLHLMQHNKQVMSFYDGDSAGWRGADTNARRLAAVGLGVGFAPEYCCAPEGLDPKDMQIVQIVHHVRTVFTI